MESRKINAGLIALCVLFLLVAFGKLLLVTWVHTGELGISVLGLLKAPELREAFLLDVIREWLFPFGILVFFAGALLLVKHRFVPGKAE